MSGMPNNQYQAPSGPTPGGIAADQASQMGQALSRTGDAVGRIAMDAADMANQVRVNDAVNQARIAAQDLAYNKDTGYLTKKGASAFLDDQGKPLELPLTQQYGDQFKTRLDELSNNLGNDRQRQLFSMHAGDLASSMHGQIESHMLNQFGAYNDHVDDATAKLAGQNAVLNWNNPDIIFGRINPETGVREGGSIAEAKAAIYSKAKRAGLVGAPYDEAVLSGISAIHEKIIQTTLANNNPEYALQYRDQALKAKELAPTDALNVQGHINLAVDTKLSTDAVSQQTVETVPKVAPTGFDRMTQITMSTESGGQRYGPDGKTLLTSPKGAKGEMQVLDSTNKNPGYGVTPAKDDSPGERARVGRDYLAALVKNYGDPAKAWAAYNGGPGTLDKAVRDAKIAERTGSGSANWLDHMPQETQAYVTKNMGMLASGAQVEKPPTELEFINGALGKLPQNPSAQAVKLTTEAAKARFTVLQKSITEQGDNALAQAQRWVMENPTAQFSQIPPALVDDLKRYAPGKYDDLNTFHKKIQEGDVKTNDALYLKLATDQKFLMNTSDDQFFALRQQLSKPDFDKFATERGNLRGGKMPNGPGDLNTSAINDTIKARFQMLKLDATPKDGSDEAMQLGVVHKFVRDKIAQAQIVAGKKFSDVETAAEVDKLFSKNVEFKNIVLGVTGAKQARPLLSSTFDDIPGPLADAIKKDLQAKGRPTDKATVLSAYINLKN